MKTYPNSFRRPNDLVVLMIWTTNPRKRKKTENVVCLNAIKELELNVGDKIIGGKIGGDESDKFSVWTIENIVDKRPASLLKYNYYSLLCSWGVETIDISSLPVPLNSREEASYNNLYSPK